jgi:Zn-dependent protease with chaperone function/uncharacterized RDD family membrane protein YckC
MRPIAQRSPELPIEATEREAVPLHATLFMGARSLRVRGERRALWLCLLSAPLTIALIGLLLKSVTIADMLLLIVAGMAYVSISRGRLLGSSIRIHARQFHDIHAIVASTSERLGIAPPQIFVRDDAFVPIAAVGIGEPYALILSSQYLEHLRPNEIRFLVARELGHIAAGHTRLTSLLSASGRENPAVALIFGAWLRRTEFTADRIGMLCTDSLADAVAAISITTFHAIGRRADMNVLAEQRREIEAEPSLRMGEWIGGVPYATNRFAALTAFANTDLFRFWRDVLERPREHAGAVEPAEGSGEVGKRDLAPNWRRGLALFIDLTVIGLILHTAVGFTMNDESAPKPKLDASSTEFMRYLVAHGINFSMPTQSLETTLAFLVYAAALVTLSGQTLGMMIADLRVVTTRFASVSMWRALWRYMVATFSLIVLPIALLGLVTRVHLHDRLSGTRLVRGRALPPTAERSG